MSPSMSLPEGNVKGLAVKFNGHKDCIASEWSLLTKFMKFN